MATILFNRLHHTHNCMQHWWMTKSCEKAILCFCVLSLEWDNCPLVIDWWQDTSSIPLWPSWWLYWIASAMVVYPVGILRHRLPRIVPDTKD